MTSSLPPCVNAFGSWEVWNYPHEGGITYVYEIVARCPHDRRVCVRVLSDEPFAYDTAIAEVARRMRRKHGLDRRLEL